MQVLPTAQPVHIERRRRGRPRTTPGAATHRKGHERIESVDADNFSNALNFARSIELEPNLFITIQWRHAECDRPPAERVRRFINLAGVWLRRRGVVVVWAYAREVGTLKGEHLHLVIHVPDRLQTKFRRAADGWVTMEATGVVRRSALRIDQIKDGDLSTSLKRYLLKESADDVRTRYWLPNTPKYRRTGGLVLGKRLKVSQSIGRKARQAALGAPESPMRPGPTP
jgi:hypothetical protein